MDDVVKVGRLLLAQIVVSGVPGGARHRYVRTGGGGLRQAEQTQAARSTAGARPTVARGAAVQLGGGVIRAPRL